MRVPPEWQEELEAATGRKSERFTWLLLDWMQGEPWDRVERYVIYEMFPPAWVERTPLAVMQFRETRAALAGPPPVTLRHFNARGEFMYSDATITQDQWELWRNHNCFSRLFWIIQGKDGGHKWRFTQSERKLLKLNGLPVDPPVPGALGYAPWDRRVRDALVRQRALQEAAFAIAGQFTPAGHIKRRVREEQDFNRSLLDWLKPQVRRGVEESDRHVRAVDLPIGPEVTDEQLESAETSFIEATPTQET